MILVLAGSPAQPPAKPAIDTKAEADEAIGFAKKLVDEFSVEIEKSGKKLKLERGPEPVLRWTNHIGRRFYGDVFVWTYKGRPEVVASVNNVFAAKRLLEAEIVSLSTDRPLLSRNGK